MDIKISTFICLTNPFSRGDLFLEAIESNLLFSDEFFVVDGGSTDGSMEMIKAKFGDKVEIRTMEWKQGEGNWNWHEFPKHWNFGVSLCQYEWVCATESDHIFSQYEANRVKEQIHVLVKENEFVVALCVDKMVSSTWDHWQSKAKMPLFIRKGKYPTLGYGLDRYRNSDLCFPIYIEKDNGEFGIPEGRLINESDSQRLGVYMMNYERTFKTLDQIITERKAANWAWNNSCLLPIHKKALPSSDCWDEWKDRMVKRYYESPYTYDNLDKHPEVMRERLKNIPDNVFGSYQFWKDNEML